MLEIIIALLLAVVMVIDFNAIVSVVLQGRLPLTTQLIAESSVRHCLFVVKKLVERIGTLFLIERGNNGSNFIVRFVK